MNKKILKITTILCSVTHFLPALSLAHGVPVNPIDHLPHLQPPYNPTRSKDITNSEGGELEINENYITGVTSSTITTKSGDTLTGTGDANWSTGVSGTVTNEENGKIYKVNSKSGGEGTVTSSAGGSLTRKNGVTTISKDGKEIEGSESVVESANGKYEYEGTFTNEENGKIYNVNRQEGGGTTVKNSSGGTLTQSADGGAIKISTGETIDVKKNSNGATTLTSSNGRSINVKRNSDGTTTIMAADGSSIKVQSPIQVSQDSNGDLVITSSSGEVVTKDADGGVTLTSPAGKNVEVKKNADGSTTITRSTGNNIEVKKNGDGTATITTYHGKNINVKQNNDGSTTLTSSKGKSVNIKKNGDQSITVTSAITEDTGKSNIINFSVNDDGDIEINSSRANSISKNANGSVTINDSKKKESVTLTNNSEGAVSLVEIVNGQTVKNDTITSIKQKTITISYNGHVYEPTYTQIEGTNAAGKETGSIINYDDGQIKKINNGLLGVTPDYASVRQEIESNGGATINIQGNKYTSEDTTVKDKDDDLVTVSRTITNNQTGASGDINKTYSKDEGLSVTKSTSTGDSVSTTVSDDVLKSTRTTATGDTKAIATSAGGAINTAAFENNGDNLGSMIQSVFKGLFKDVSQGSLKSSVEEDKEAIQNEK